MMRRLARTLAALAALCSAAGASAAAEADYRARRENLLALSQILGELHHVRRMCSPRREADVWRERMKQLVALEEPADSQKAQMVAAFNDGYRGAQRAFRSCDRAAEDFAAARAEEAQSRIEGLTAPLYEALREDEAEIAVRSGGDGP